jgi:hypothetical protein
MIDVPDIQKISAKFIYNFFQQDERTNDSGDKKAIGSFLLDNSTDTFSPANKTQRQATLNTSVPRYVEVSFEPSQKIAYGNLKSSEMQSTAPLVTENDFGGDFENLLSEDNITNDSFVSLRESDSEAKSRISEKMSKLSESLGLEFDNSNQSQSLSDILNFNKSAIQEMLSPYSDPKVLKVNTIPDSSAETMFTQASKMRIYSQVNKRVSDEMQVSGNSASGLGVFHVKSAISELSKKFRASASSQLNEADIYPAFSPYKITRIDDETTPIGIIGAASVGYIIYKTQLSPSGRVAKETKKLVIGIENTKFLDSEVIYGSRYGYAVSIVYRVDAVVNAKEATGKDSKHRIQVLIESRPSQVQFVKTEEYEPPKPPDGVFYRFNFSAEAGLIITWQTPAGRSRDVKYFQVFKRSSIMEAFKCIAEIDFDDSLVKTLRPESVRNDLVIKSKGSLTYFEDKSFNRDSGQSIYAVCAIDAHGFTSGYSTQTLVGFNKFKNSITLKNISRPGAPKQYPNFFVDPDLDDNIAVDSFSQDAIFDSGRKKMYVYFTPDAKTLTTNDGATAANCITTTDTGLYKMHVINLDLQKSTTVEMSISNNEKL